jgi:hypothetical protein
MLIGDVKNGWIMDILPSGKQPHNELVKITMLMGNSTISIIFYSHLAIFNSFLYVYQRV